MNRFLAIKDRSQQITNYISQNHRYLILLALILTSEAIMIKKKLNIWMIILIILSILIFILIIFIIIVWKRKKNDEKNEEDQTIEAKSDAGNLFLNMHDTSDADIYIENPLYTNNNSTNDPFDQITDASD